MVSDTYPSLSKGWSLTDVIVFRYSFTILMEEEKNGRKEWRERTFIVMWDYQVGLVRITPFFKACKYTKVSRLPSYRCRNPD